MGEGIDRSVSGIQGLQRPNGTDQNEGSMYQAMDPNAAPVTADQLQKTLTMRM